LGLGRLFAVGEIGIAVAELLGEVEPQPLGELDRRAHGLGVVGKACGGLVRRAESGLVVSPPLGLAALERRPVLDRDEDVLKIHPAGVVNVDIAGCDRADAERFGELAQRTVTPDVAAHEGMLQLDEEAVAAEDLRHTGGGVGVVDGESRACATGQCDETVVVVFQLGEIEARLEAFPPMRRG
jgi:hypothetical protein